MSRGMLSLFAGLAQGANEGVRARDDRDRQNRMDAIALAREARAAKADKLDDDTQDAMIKAGQPVVAQDAMLPVPAGEAPQQRMMPDPTTDAIDIGQAGTAAPIPAVTVAGGQPIAATDAPAALAAANSPYQTRMRQATAVGQVNPDAAIKVQALAEKSYDDDLSAAAGKGLQAIVDFTNASGASPGKSKLVKSDDGKTVEIHQVMPDGSDQATGMKFTNDQAGAASAAMLLSKHTPPAAKLAHYDQEARDATTREDKLADNKRLDSALVETGRHNKAMEDVYSEKNTVAQNKVDGKTMRERMSEADAKTYDQAGKRLEKVQETIDKAKADGSWDPDKNPSQKSLQADADAALLRTRTLENRYSSSAAAAPSDPYGLKKPAAGAAAGADPSLPAPMRNNNPGALMPGGKMAQYKTAEEGLAALDANLKKYGEGGHDTIAKVISRWAPPNENDTQAYIKDVAMRTGFDPNAKLDMSSAYVRQALSAAITSHENGVGAVARSRGTGSPVNTSMPPAGTSVGGPKTANAAERPTQDIPPAPPPTKQIIGPGGVAGKVVPNPAYEIWQRTYGAAADEAKRQEEAAIAAATAASRTAPYRPERAPYARMGS